MALKFKGIIFNVLLLIIIAHVCGGKVNKTGKVKTTTPKNVDDDADFGVSLIEDTPASKGDKNDSNANNRLADAIVKAVGQFASERKASGNFDLAALLSSVGIGGNIFNARATRSVPESEIPEDEFAGLESASDNESLFKELHDEVPSDSDFNKAFGDDETPPSNTQSNINKIPKKVVLSRQPKSLDSNLIKETVINNSSASAEVLDDDDVINDGNKVGVDILLEVYSADRLIENWNIVKKSLSTSCRKHTASYLRGLRHQKYWALKMDDATGRYTSGYYWGNAYWSGSATLCDNVLNTPANQMKGAKRSDDFTRNDFLLHDVSIEISEQPPFNVSFFMAKVQLNSSAVIGHKTIQLGLCFPDSCTGADIKSIIELLPTNTRPTVLRVRDPKHDHFNLLTDLTFQILVGVTVVIMGLMLAGTIYELILISKVKSLAMNKLKNIPPVTGLASVKMSNGKSIYAVNNGIPNNNNNSEERLNIEPNQMDDSPQLSIFSEIILSFSVVSNLKTICDQSVGSDTIPTIHGLRTISMIWVILGHSCIIAFKYADNTELRKVVEKEFAFQAVTNGSFGVDTFFCISGILVSYIYFRTNAKGSLERLTQGTRGFVSGTLQFIGLLAYRFARLTAPYLFMLGVVEVSMKWFYHNSVFEPPTQDHINCPKYWWRNVLYINTLFPFEQMCMLWSWYLADDSQFYVLGAVILILAASHFKTAAVALVIFLVSSWGTTGYIAYSNNHSPSSEDPLALFDKIYDKPWTRLGPYLIGMSAGWLLFKTDCKIKMSKVTVITGWTLSAFISLYLVYGLYNVELTPIAGAAHSSLSHTAWAISISWIVVACSTGYGGYINSLLSATILYPFSRVTYCAYLVHPVVIRFLPMHMDHPIHLGKDMVTLVFLGQVVASYFLSFLISLAFEAPVVTMLKILAPNRRKKIQ